MTEKVIDAPVKKQRRGLAEVMHRLSKSPLAMFGLGFIVLLVICAIFANQLAPFSFSKQNLMHTFELPSAKHLLGTDEFGRDIMSRLIYGARVSLQVGFIAVGISLVVGGLLGAFSGFYGGTLDNVIMRVMDVLLAVPQTLLAIAIAAKTHTTGIVALASASPRNGFSRGSHAGPPRSLRIAHVIGCATTAPINNAIWPAIGVPHWNSAAATPHHAAKTRKEIPPPRITARA